MKFVRIEALGTAELHPRLTLLRGVTPEQRRRLESLLQAISAKTPFESAGMVEVNGVHLNLDSDTVERLRLDEGLGWILDWETGATQHQPPAQPQTPVKQPSAQQQPPAQPQLPAQPQPLVDTAGGNPGVLGDRAAGDPFATADPGSDKLAILESLRESLRATAAERTQLAGEMDQVRVRLDSFANAALEVCVGQIDALEAKRSALRRQFEAQKRAVDGRLGELEATYRDHLAEVEAVESLDLTDVRSSRDRLAAEIEQNRGPDPQFIELALRIDATMRRVRDLSGRAAAVSLRRREAEQRLAESVAEVNALERALKQRTFDPAVVARLEQVRDELFADDERPSRLSVNRNRRRMLSLRDEEARLLAQLGFDTYSSYVMGIPSMRSEVERSARVDQARARVEAVQRELDSLEEPAEALLATSEADLRALLSTAATLLGEDQSDTGAHASAATSAVPGTTVPGSIVTDSAVHGSAVSGSGDGSGWPGGDQANASGTSDARADEVARVIERLRSTQLDTGVDGHPEVLAAADELRRAINALAGGRFADPAGAKPPRIAGSAIAPQSWTGAPSTLLRAVDVWLERIGDTSAWLKSAREAVEQLRTEIDDLSGAGETPVEVSEWARVEAELDSLLDKLVGAQERVRRNEEALVELAAQREHELLIRARERDLLAQIAEVEEAFRSTPEPAATPTESQQPVSAPAVEVPPHPTDRAAATATAEPTAAVTAAVAAEPATGTAPATGGGSVSGDPEWAFVKFAARRRSVSFAGSLPIVMFHLADCGAAGTALRDQVCDRVIRLSELVQIVLIDDSEWAADRVGSLGMDARIIQL